MDSPNQGLIESYLPSDTVLHILFSFAGEIVCVCVRVCVCVWQKEKRVKSISSLWRRDLDNGRLGDSMRGLGGPPGEL